MKVRIAVAVGHFNGPVWAARGAHWGDTDEHARSARSMLSPYATDVVYVDVDIPDKHFYPAVVQGQVAEEATDE